MDMKKYEPCCGDTACYKGGTLPMGSCELHMMAPEMLRLLKYASESQGFTGIGGNFSSEVTKLLEKINANKNR